MDTEYNTAYIKRNKGVRNNELFIFNVDVEYKNAIVRLLDIENLPDNVKISTMTIHCKINKDEEMKTLFNLDNIYKYLKGYEKITDVISTRMDGDTNVLVKPQKRNVSIKRIYENDGFYGIKYRKKRKCPVNKVQTDTKNIRIFYNQITIYLLVPNKDKPISIKLFSNGSMHFTGCHNMYDFVNGIELVFYYLMNYNDDEVNLFCYDVSKLCFQYVIDTKINMINSDIKFPFSINRKHYYDLLSKSGQRCLFDTNTHAGAISKYECVDEDGTVKKTLTSITFGKTSIIITGAKNCAQIKEAFQYKVNEILENYEYLYENQLSLLKLYGKYNFGNMNQLKIT